MKISLLIALLLAGITMQAVANPISERHSQTAPYDRQPHLTQRIRGESPR